MTMMTKEYALSIAYEGHGARFMGDDERAAKLFRRASEIAAEDLPEAALAVRWGNFADEAEYEYRRR